jgi:hypothetical protein
MGNGFFLWLTDKGLEELLKTENMKKLLTMLVLAGLACSNAMAQSKYVCKNTRNPEKPQCYKTDYNHNFKVCKDAYGYHICGRERTYATATAPKLPMVAPNRAPVYSMESSNTAMPQNLVAPQSQSYPSAYAGEGAMTTGSYQGYRSRGTGKIKVCYIGDNVAELNRAAYNGCTTPAWEGPEKNNVRNLNVSSPNEVPPLDGNNSGR